MSGLNSSTISEWYGNAACTLILSWGITALVLIIRDFENINSLCRVYWRYDACENHIARLIVRCLAGGRNETQVHLVVYRRLQTMIELDFDASLLDVTLRGKAAIMTHGCEAHATFHTFLAICQSSPQRHRSFGFHSALKLLALQLRLFWSRSSGQWSRDPFALRA